MLWTALIPLIALLGILLIVFTYLRERRAVLDGLAAGSRLVETACGPVEVGEWGEGPPLVILHGAAGSYDQGLEAGRALAPSRYRLIAPSRPGYLRTPLAAGRTPAEQADLLAALLDALGVPAAVVVGYSAGGMAAIHFAARYPDRCRGLILGSAVSGRLIPARSRLLLGRALIASDFATWLLLKLAEPPALARMGRLSGESLNGHTTREFARAALRGFAISSLRRAGMLNDVRQAQYAGFPLEAIRAPTLVAHGTGDPIVPYAFAERATAAIPGAELLAVEGGGHLCLITHADRAAPVIADFLERCYSSRKRRYR